MKLWTMELKLNGAHFNLRFPVVMGVLNVTPDSFSDGGLYCEPQAALDRFEQMREEGAQIIDVGAESTRPGSDPVSEKDELDRLLPIIEALPKDGCMISVDTNKPAVQKIMLQAGVHMINDVFGGNTELIDLASSYQAALTLMHTPAPPKNMQAATNYQNVVTEVRDWLLARVQETMDKNIPAVWVDPGIGFGKTLQQNLEIMRQLDQFCGIGTGVAIGVSRKSWIGQLTGADVKHRLGGKERYGFRMVMRSQNDSRGGYYWIVRRGHTRVYMPKGGKFVLEYFPEGSGTAIKHEYPLRRISHERTIFLGVTGGDWPSDKAKPLAWRIQLQDANGKVLEAKQSYLWEFPSN